MPDRVAPADTDLVLYVPGIPEALHAAVKTLYAQAKERVRAGGDKVDHDTGEVKPRVYRLTFGEAEDEITVRQRNFLHGVVFKQIAEAIPGDFSIAAVKEFYRRKFLGTDGNGNRWEMQRLPGWKKAVPVRVRVSTEGLGVKAYSEHIDRVMAHAATEYGIEFQFDEQEREAVRYRRPARKPKAAAAAQPREEQPA